MRCVALVVLALFYFGVSASGQETFDVQRGINEFGSYKGGNLDSVNMMSGNVTLHIPILSFPQRGKALHLNYNLYYNDKQWTFNYVPVPPASGQGNWQLVTQHVGAYLADDAWLGTGMVQTTASGGTGSGPCSTTMNNRYIWGPDDSRHFVGSDANSSNGCATGFGNDFGGAIDDSGYTAVTNGIVDRNGVLYSTSGNTGTMTDPDGNYMSLNLPTPLFPQVTDTLGRTIPSPASIAVSSTPCSAGTASAYVWNVPGSSVPYYLCYKGFAFQTAFNLTSYQLCFALTSSSEDSGTASMLAELVLPNTTRYTFTYDSYLSLSRLTLPTGGYIAYTWQNKMLDCHNTGAAVTRVLTSRTLNDGTTSSTWHYQWFANGTNWIHVVTDPMGNDEVHYITMSNGTTIPTVESQVDSYNGCSTVNSQYCTAGGSLLKSVQTSYQYDNDVIVLTSNQFRTQPSPIPAVRTTTIPTSSGNLVSKVTYTLAPTQYTRTYQYMSNNLVLTGSVAWSSGQTATVTEYDFGNGAPGPAIRATTTTFKWQDTSNGTSYFNPNNYGVPNLIDLPLTVVTSDGSGNKCAETDYAYDEFPPTSSGVSMHVTTAPWGSIRGNGTTATRQLSTTPCTAGATWTGVASHSHFYDTGEKYQDTDPLGNMTTYSYSSTYYGAYHTQTQLPTTGSVQHIVNGTYDFNTGLITSFIGQNGTPETTNYTWDFNMRRILGATFPDGGRASLSYNDTIGSLSAQLSQTQTSAISSTKKAVFDGLGRTKQSQLFDPEGTDFTDTTYDGDGRVATVSNPYRSTSDLTYGITQSQFDGVGRTTKVTKQDNSIIRTVYGAACSVRTTAFGTTVTDESGHSRTSCTDGLGRLVEVDEPGSLITLYNYDPLGNLTCVEEHGGVTGTGCSSSPSNDATSPWRVRRFTYDSFSRLLTAHNPESGLLSYSYDNNGNVLSKVAPLPNQTGSATVTTNYTYDALNRLTGKTYVGMSTAAPKYGYDGVAPPGCTPPTLADTYPIGRRTSMCDGSGATSWSHDTMGRVLTESRNVNGFTRNFGYQYNLDGSLWKLTYSSGRVITYTYAPTGNTVSAGRQVSATDSTGIIYANNALYASFGGLSDMIQGTTPITIKNRYSPRLQPVLLSAFTSSATIMSLCYDFHSDVALSSSGYGPCSFSASSLGNNGNIYQIVNNRDNNRTQNFMYDSLNRIQQAYSTGPNWGETYSSTATAPGVVPPTSGIDAWGNMTNHTGVTGKTTTEGTFNCPANTNNQLTTCGVTYDAAGNAYINNGVTYTYDAENRLVTPGAGNGTYLYDGDGNRMAKLFSSSGTLYWRDLSGTTLLEDSNSGIDLREYIYFDGKRVARRHVQSNVVLYYFSDHLQSTSIMTDALGTMSSCNGYVSGQYESDYFPYGGEMSICARADQTYKFTGKERDSESGLDNFGARYFTSSLGRFMTPDWAARPTAVPYAVFGDPQSLNLYNYVRNDPVSRADSDGHCPLQANGQQQNGGCPQLTVTVKKDSEPHVMHGQQPNPDIAKVGTTTTVKVTDAKGAAVVGATVKENPVTTNNLTHTKGNNLANPQALTTGEKGTIKDVVAQQVVKEPTSTEEIQDHVNSTPYDRTTVQSLTITTQGPDGKACTCSATYSEHMTNVGPDGKLNEPNSSGVNYKLDIEPEVVQTTPQ